ncbi:MAG: hypothetical protein LC650_03995 [Actinobacteria bacterium]|nr:hypothetical protein [Actinomycetota bacterium]
MDETRLINYLARNIYIYESQSPMEPDPDPDTLWMVATYMGLEVQVRAVYNYMVSEDAS